MEDVISGVRLRRRVAFHPAVCVQLPLLLGPLPESYYQYRLGGATSHAPRDSGAVTGSTQPARLGIASQSAATKRRLFASDECLIGLFAASRLPRIPVGWSLCGSRHASSAVPDHSGPGCSHTRQTFPVGWRSEDGQTRL